MGWLDAGRVIGREVDRMVGMLVLTRSEKIYAIIAMIA